MAKLPKLSKPTESSISGLDFDRLRKWNALLAVIYAVQGLAILLLATVKSLPVTVAYLVPDQLLSDIQGRQVLVQTMQHLFDLNVAYIVAAFLFLGTIAHGLVVFRVREWYEANLRRGVNVLRWIELGLSSGLMILAIGLVSGVSDLSLLVVLFMLPIVANACGLMLEMQDSGAHRLRWVTYSMGALAGLIPWVILLIYLISTQVFGNGVPVHTWIIFVTMLVLFKGYAINMWLQSNRWGRWQQYLFSEKAYMILSVVAKTALAWQIFAGSLRP